MQGHFLVKMMPPSHGGLAILVVVTPLISELVLYGHLMIYGNDKDIMGKDIMDKDIMDKDNG